MSFLKRMFLFLTLNFLIVLTASLIMTVLTYFFGVQGEWTFYLIFYSLIGFGGAFFSLALSKWFAKKMMGVQIIDPHQASGQERELIDMVHALARKARLPKMPEVGIYGKPELNAFATGPSKSNSLVAVSRGLLNSMSKEAIEGVLAHEVAHIANGDMVTMTLLQGLLNTMVLLAARFVAKVLSSTRKNQSLFMEHIYFMFLQIVFSILASIVLCYFSRLREYRADKDGAKLAGPQSMIAALKALHREFNPHAPVSDNESSYAYLKISGIKKGNIFSTHPPLEDRIARLERLYS